MQIQSLPVAWMERVCGGSIPAVLSLYNDHAVLVPTYGHIKVGKPQMLGYFKTFMDKPNLCGKINTEIVQRMPNGMVYSGIYTFSWTGGKAQALYTFVVVGNKIITHHSAEDPRA